MEPVIKFDCQETEYINVDKMERTVRLVPRESGRGASYGELLDAIEQVGVPTAEIEGIFKVSPTDNSFSILLKYDDSIQPFIETASLKAGNMIYDIMKMAEQVVTVRVHWLPIYYDSSILYELFSKYGEVLDIKMMKTAHAKITTFNGSREVKLKTDEFRKHIIPHLVNFNSGQSILLTIPGRPPYCLRCNCTGHIRSRCPGRLNYAQVLHTRSIPAVAVTRPDAPPPQPDVRSGNDISNPDSTPAPTAVGSGEVGAVGRGSQEQLLDSIEMEQPSSKRERESETDDGWFTPNKTARASQSGVPSPPSLDNHYECLMASTRVLNKNM